MPSTINLKDATYYVQFYACIFLGSYGVISNILNIVVNCRKKLRQTNMCFYNVIVSTFNILILIRFLISAPSFGLTDMIFASRLTCVLIPYLTRIFLQTSVWVYVFISFDRTILMSYKVVDVKKNNSLHKNKRNKLMLLIMGLIVLILLINAPGLFYYISNQTSFNPLTNQTTISVSCTAAPIVSLLRDIVAILSRFLLQLIFKSILTFILVYKLFKLKINVTTLSLKREYVFTFTISILNIISILSDLFVLVSYLFIYIYGYNQTYISTTSNESAIASFVYVCAVVISIFLLCDLLFIVNLITNKEFRKEAKRLLIEICSKLSWKISYLTKNETSSLQ
jgi:hypothetical protein